jgi:hypothetical protein
MVRAATGGTLTLTAPGGIGIVVKIPPGALLADTKITATPITRFQVAPVHGGFVAGVQLAPEGLDLLKAGSVEFRPRMGLSPTRRYFLGSQGNGSNVSLVPPAFRKVGRGRTAKLDVVSKPIVPILHFSTVEAFDWSKANLRDLDEIRYTQSPIDRARQEIAIVLGIERQKQLFGFEDVVDLSEMSTVVERFRDHVLKPRLQVVTAALTSRCSLHAVQDAHDTLVLALQFVRQEQLLGLPASFDTAELMGPILKGTADCMLQQCSRYGPRIIPFLFGLGRQVELIGASASEEFFNVLFDDLRLCSIGKVHLDSAIAYDDPHDCGGLCDTHYYMRVVGDSFFEYSAEKPGWVAYSALLKYQDVHGGSKADCGAGFHFSTRLSAHSNGSFRVNQINFRPLDPTKPDIGDPIGNLTLTITQEPKEYEETLTNCLNPVPSQVTDWWARLFTQILHPTLRFDDFSPDAAPVVALAVYTKHDHTLHGTTSENTLLEVISTPGPIKPLPDPFG